MKRLPPPLRFLVGLCAGWTCARAGLLWLAAPGAADPPPLLAPRPLAVAGPAAAGARVNPLQVPRTAAAASIPEPLRRGERQPHFREPFSSASVRLTAPVFANAPRAEPAGLLRVAAASPPSSGKASGSVAPLASAPPGLAVPTVRGSRPWAVSAWAFVRRGGGATLAPGGILGGSQAGVRATYRIAGNEAPLAVSLRVTVPVERPRGAEAAAGVDWKPIARLPVHLLLERRQRLGAEGRSAFGVTVYGGGEAKLGPLHVDGYAQAGIVGARRRDLFADGGVRAAVPLGPLRLGAGAWAAAQPGTSRIDVGPHAALRLRPLNAAVLADWRFRVAGSARPGSGPALTLAADF